eukprot:370009-Amphidinium_carterae.1
MDASLSMRAALRHCASHKPVLISIFHAVSLRADHTMLLTCGPSHQLLHAFPRGARFSDASARTARAIPCAVRQRHHGLHTLRQV